MNFLIKHPLFNTNFSRCSRLLLARNSSVSTKISEEALLNSIFHSALHQHIALEEEIPRFDLSLFPEAPKAHWSVTHRKSDSMDHVEIIAPKKI
mmetsp:Transcript_6548/g.8631  ORF Transcript_6548/g.8631 Transcript_6548/m.8631 type:complete len:94 (+) Transcript_6548:147-428(+)